MVFLLIISILFYLLISDVEAHIPPSKYLSNRNITSLELDHECRCGTRSYTDLELIEINEKLNMNSDVEIQKIKPIRLFFHNIQSTKKQGNIDNDVLTAQVRVLNKAFHKIGIQFTLSGVSRIQDNKWFKANMNSIEEREMKRQLHQGTYADLNVYTVSSQDSTLGWASLPTVVGSNIYFDGVVVDYRTLPGGSLYPYNLGQTLTHEVGHWLGLLHTFEGGCVEALTGGDGIADTPAEQYPHFGCPPDNTNTCKGKTGGLRGKDPIHNYMGYTDDACMQEFTPEQGKRTQNIYKIVREHL